MLRDIVSKSIAFACLFSSTAALADVHQVALLNPDSELLRSATIALSAWGVPVVALEAPPLPRSLPEAVVEARTLAATLHFGAVVWVSVAEANSAVWVYDAETQEVSSRVQAALPPFDAPGAAAVALSLKTLLRGTSLAPPSERFGAAAPEPSSLWPGLLRLDVSAGARVFAPNELEPWLRLGAVVWPARGDSGWGLFLRGAASTGATVDALSVSGVVREMAVFAGVNRRIVLGHVAIIPSAGASAYFTRFDAAISGAKGPISVQRVNPALDVGVALALRLFGPLDVGPYVAASYLVRYQEYLVGGKVAFQNWPVGLEFGAQATTSVF